MDKRILEGALNVFRVKGLKFTMDDIASEMKMSKKTIYTIFEDKKDLMCKMMDYAFDLIKEEEDKVYYDDSLDTVAKIRGILAVFPESHYGFDYCAVHQLAIKYPQVYEKLQYRLESGWDKTVELIRRGIAEGAIKNININIFKVMFEASADRLLMGKFLSSSDIDYPAALEEMVNMLIDGIVKRDNT